MKIIQILCGIVFAMQSVTLAMNSLPIAAAAIQEPALAVTAEQVVDQNLFINTDTKQRVIRILQGSIPLLLQSSIAVSWWDDCGWDEMDMKQRLITIITTKYRDLNAENHRIVGKYSRLFFVVMFLHDCIIATDIKKVSLLRDLFFLLCNLSDFYSPIFIHELDPVTQGYYWQTMQHMSVLFETPQDKRAQEVIALLKIQLSQDIDQKIDCFLQVLDILITRFSETFPFLAIIEEERPREKVFNYTAESLRQEWRRLRTQNQLTPRTMVRLTEEILEADDEEAYANRHGINQNNLDRLLRRVSLKWTIKHRLHYCHKWLQDYFPGLPYTMLVTPDMLTHEKFNEMLTSIFMRR